jgi:ABC-type multidrug transport system fused ATPase/permease subunit
MLPDKVLACGISAVALLILALLLRGLLKVITLAIVLVLAAGIFWFLRDGLGGQSDALPHEWTRLAERTLDSQKARAAWQAVQSELAKLSADARTRLFAGTDDTRRIVVAKLEAKAQKLRKEGNSTEAEQIARLAALVEKEK